MKPLLPTLKEKKRYLAYEITSTKPLAECSHAFIRELQRLLGMFDSAAAGLQSIKYNKKTQQGILRTSTKTVPKVRAALTLIQQLNGVHVRIVTKSVSGILNKTERFMEV